MNRRDRITRHVSKAQRGIEVGPWFNGLTPKREGYDCLIMDVFDTATLRSRAAADPTISDEQAALIEDVDITGSSVAIGNLVSARGEAGTFSYVLSSHNFEHLPNPIQFLQGCSEALCQTGILSMAIPDHRYCFDYFRPITRLSDWIQSFYIGQEQPSLAQAFEGRLAFAHYTADGQKRYDLSSSVPATAVRCDVDLADEWVFWASRMQKEEASYREAKHGYIDAHCSVFTPASFELLIRDCGYLGLTRFVVAEVSSEGAEFDAHLRLAEADTELRPPDYASIRTRLLHRIRNEEAENACAYQHLQQKLAAKDEALRRAEQEIASHIERALSQEKAVKHHEQEQISFDATVADLIGKSQHHEAMARRLQSDYDAVLNSTTWRSTAALRSVLGWMPRPVRRRAREIPQLLSWSTIPKLSERLRQRRNRLPSSKSPATEE